ncbi:MAG: FAD-dependent oxidoreductase [Clostridia bacterium]|nr:FAD-dependent oxidoreductase [Clostridia bacterium]
MLTSGHVQPILGRAEGCTMRGAQRKKHRAGGARGHVGRCISADEMAFATKRIQATVMAIGESAGLMAAEICDHGSIDPMLLNAVIRQRGVTPSGL